MGFSFSTHSRQQLDTVDSRLVRVVERALSFNVIDFKVVEGARTDEQQREYVRQGVSKVQPGPNAKHTVGPASGRTKAHAVDLLPVNPADWEDRERFAVLAGLMFAAAALEGVKIRWGGDWDGDMQTRDEKFRDSPHFELAL